MGESSQQIKLKPIFLWSHLIIILYICENVGCEEAGFRQRFAPFCIDADPAKEHLTHNSERFKPIMSYQPGNVRIDTKVLPEHGGNGYIKQISLTRMVVDENNSFEKTHAMSNLRNWIHIKVVPATDIVGFYMQAIKGPLGIPFGNFVIDFECKDCHDAEILESAKPVGQIVPCKARAKSSARHPNVLVVAGKHLDTKYIKEHGFHFHFNWIEAPCDDVPIFQFLMVAVKSWGDEKGTTMDYKIFYSQPYDNTVMDTKTGVFWPLDPRWKDNKTIICHGDPVQKVKLNVKPYKELASKDIIRMDKNYEKCMFNNEMASGYQCPPGPFVCKNFPSNEADWKAQRKIQIKNTMKRCKTCPTKEVKEHHLKNSEHEYYENNAKYFMQGILKMHGVLMVMCWTLFSSLSGYIARFHKETSQIYPGTGCFAMGNFLWGHMGFSYLCLAAMWGAIFLVTLIFFMDDTGSLGITCILAFSSKEQQETCANSPVFHAILGAIAMIFFHSNQCLGWWRPSNPFWRNVYIFLHVILGYGSKLIACGAAFATAVPFDVLMWILIAEGLSLVMYIAASIVQWIADKNMKIDPPRSLCPVPEGIDTFDDIPNSGLRICNLLLHYGLQTVCFVVFCIYYRNSLDTE